MEKTRNHFDTVADEYDTLLPEHVQEHYRKKRVRLIGRLLEGGPGSREYSLRSPGSREYSLRGKLALDVGCGTGKLMEALRGHGTVYGVDGSMGMLRVLRREGRGEAAAASVRMLPFADASFDVVFCVAVLHHVAAPEAVRRTIHEMVRVAKPGGAVMIWDHNPRNPYWPHLMRRAPQDTGEERLIPAAEIVRALEESGAREVRVIQSGFVPEFVPRAAMPCARLAEAVLERTPLLRRFSAHNVITARKV